MADPQIKPPAFSLLKAKRFAPKATAQQTMWTDSGATLSVVAIDCTRARIIHAAICLKTLPRVSDWCLSFERPSPDHSFSGRLGGAGLGNNPLCVARHVGCHTTRLRIAAKQLAGLVTGLAFSRADLACKLYL